MTAPTIDHLLGLSAEYVQRTETVLADGDIATTESIYAGVPCYVERMTVLEIRDNEEVTIGGWRGYFLPTFSASDGDALRIPGMVELEFVGPANPIVNPRERYVHHVEARLREVA